MANNFTFQPVPSRINFPKAEEEILNYWKEIDAFRTSIKLSKNRKPFSFYDGPPFATGLPHYGHILAGTIKDIVPRYAHQTGHCVKREFGWDTHGLPVEFEIDKKLGIKSHKDVLAMGIEKYNAACREIVMRYSQQWEKTITRCGRWVDFENGYKTLDLGYMESVWWVFKTVFEKGLIYRGNKIMPFSTRLGTPLSNFEANLNYKDTTDNSIIVKFPLESNPSKSFLAWTTTPWTLPSNLALCVKAAMDYVCILDCESGEKWILAEKRLCELYKKPLEGKNYKVLSRHKGAHFENERFTPIFDYFPEYKDRNAFRVLCDDYVTDKSGTGVVHQAPGFGEDDYRICFKCGIIGKGEEVLCPVDANGRFTRQVKPLEGLYVKDAEQKIIRDLKDRKRLVRQKTINHSYPFCWRSDTPLIYKAVPSWFLNVERIKSRLQANTAQTRWVPGYVRDKRFGNWLADARDWAISRSRFWGTPLPVWANSDFTEVVVVGSVSELEELSGVRPIADLHRETIDAIKIPSKTPGKHLVRVEDVFDCWFESGSMPYAQKHYPFENKHKFERSFPADFVGEGLDQTRGWFYTLMVLSTALFDKPAFKNLICTGLVLAEDGKKMSKRLQNYPPPSAVIDEFGADALRLYLINSPVVRGEPLRFSKKGVFNVVKDVLLLWHNTYRFFVENATRFEKETGEKFRSDATVFRKTENELDKWIFSSLQSLIEEVRAKMDQYRLCDVTPPLLKFLSQLSQWYVRISRERMKGLFGAGECRVSLQTLHAVLLSLCRLMAPFAPFITETMYLNLRGCFERTSPLLQDSVHYLMAPRSQPEAKAPEIERAMRRVQCVVELGRTARDSRSLRLKQPLAEMIVVHPSQEYLDDVKSFREYIEKDLNVRSVRVCLDLDDFAYKRCVPDRRSLGRRLRGKSKAVIRALEKLSQEEIAVVESERAIVVEGETVSPSELAIQVVPKDAGGRFVCAGGDGGCVVLDTRLDEGLRDDCSLREILSFVQKFKKELGLSPSAETELFYSAEGKVHELMQRNEERVCEKLNQPIHRSTGELRRVLIGKKAIDVGGTVFRIYVCRPKVVFSEKLRVSGETSDGMKCAMAFLETKRWAVFKEQVAKNGGKVSVPLEEGVFDFEHRRDFFFSMAEYEESKRGE